jgi:hypothetical protein
MAAKTDVTARTGVLLGEAPTPAVAAAIAHTYRQCPYCVCYVSAGRTVVGVFSLPPDRRWWLEWAATDPKGTLGLSRAEVFFAEAIEASSPWSRGEAQPNLEQAPCGANCRKCPEYRERCQGCPGTRDYVSS